MTFPGLSLRAEMRLGAGVYGAVYEEEGCAVKVLTPESSEYTRVYDLIPRSQLKELVAYRALEGAACVAQLEKISHDKDQRLRIHAALADGDLECEGSRGLAPKSVLEQLCLGLAEMHSRGVIHNDLKPSNILYRGARVYITDFGMALFDSCETERPIRGRGCPAFEAPEQKTSGFSTRASDVFALALSFLYWLSGKKPAATPSVLLRRLATPSLRACHLVPPEPCEAVRSFEPLLDAMLSTAPGLRPSAAEAYRRLIGMSEEAYEIPTRVPSPQRFTQEKRGDLAAAEMMLLTLRRIRDQVHWVSEEELAPFLGAGVDLLARSGFAVSLEHAVACAGLLIKMHIGRTVSSCYLSCIMGKVLPDTVRLAETQLLEALDYALHLPYQRTRHTPTLERAFAECCIRVA